MLKFQDAKKILYNNKTDLFERGAHSISIFGSFANNMNKNESDIDILVDFDSKRGLFVFLNLKYYLEELLRCEVDLVTKKALHPALKKRILSEAKKIF